jgi:beta-lactamase regulating signal transducer with metallopeptidase domain
MNNPWLAPHSWTGSFAWTVVWQTTLWLTAGLLAGRLLRRHAARAHLALVLTTAAALISPMLTAAVGWMEWGALPLSNSTAVSATEEVTLDDALRTSVVSASVDGPRLDSMARSPEPSQPVQASMTSAANGRSWSSPARDRASAALSGAWILCSLLLAVRLATSLLAGRRVVGQAITVTHPGLLAALREAADILAVRPKPVLRASAAARCPMIWCWGRQPVLLAPHSAARLEGVSWPSVFCHELAHWLRRDHWAALWTDFVLIAVPWHPLAWLARRQLAFLREQACDDWVLAHRGEATDYAASLLNLIPQGRPAYALSVLSSRESLKGRLEHILAGLEVVPRIGRRWIAGAALFALAGVAGAAFAQQRSGVKEIPPRAPRPNSPAGSEKVRPAQRISGRVVGPDGKRVSGARIFIVRFWDFMGKGSELKATSSSDGHFDFDLQPDSFFGAFALQVVAVKPGYGPGWIDIAPSAASSDLTLTLAADDVPVEGRVVNLEGRPVAGATVELVRIRAFPKDDPGPYIELLKNDPMRASNYPFLSQVDHPPGIDSLRTDDRGFVRFAGIGRHRLAELAVSGDGIADTKFQVLTDPPSAAFNHSEQTLEGEPVYGAQFVHHVRPSRLIVGTVTEFGSDRPIAGAHVSQFNGLSRATTDAKGRFELRGCAKTDRYRLCASAPRGEALLSGAATIPGTPGLGPLEVQLHVYPAIPVKGRVIDQATGKPIPADVAYWPLYPNPQIVTGMCGTAINACGAFSQSFTQPNGDFALVALPGPGAVVVRVAGKQDFEPVLVDAATFFAKEGVPYAGADGKGNWKDSLAVAIAKTSLGAVPQSNFQGIALLNVSESAKQLTQNISVRSKSGSGRN